MERGKIITTLRQRRVIEQQIRALLQLTSPDAIARQVDAIVAHGDGVIPTLLANLDTTDPHFRGALGLIAARLPAESVAPALRNAAGNQALSDQARLTAVMILERYLGEQSDANALAGLEDPHTVALQSVHEVITESARDRSILVDYARSFREQPADVARMVLDAIEQLPAPDQLELLRMLAQDDRTFVRDQALALLSRNRTPAASRALQLLLPTMPAEMQPLLERALRKLTLAGFPAQSLPEPEASWRVLVSPIDGQGTQSIWFLQEFGAGAGCRFLSLLINDQFGLKDAFGGDHIAGQRFPTAAPLGTLHEVPLHDSTLTLHLMEAGFDYGRRLVLGGLRVNFERHTPTPPEYRLMNDFLWGYRLAEEALVPQLPALDADGAHSLLPHTGRLLDLPYFATWFVQSPSILEYAGRLRSTAVSGGNVSVPRHWLVELTNAHFQEEEPRASCEARLRGMSEWLLLSGQADAGRLCLAAAQALDDTPPAEHPLLLRLVQLGLSIAISTLTQGVHLRVTRPGD